MMQSQYVGYEVWFEQDGKQVLALCIQRGPKTCIVIRLSDGKMLGVPTHLVKLAD